MKGVRGVKLLKNREQGQSMTEYVLIIALVALVAFAAVKMLGSKTKAGLTNAGEKVQEATSESR